MVASTPGSFWLRCTAFEELMLAQDSPEYPCAICLRLELSAALDQQRVAEALRQLSQRHPMLRARLVRRWHKLWWHIQAELPPSLKWHTESTPDWPELARINLSLGPGMHVDVYPGSDESATGCVMFLQVHHALADGLGCLKLVEDFLSRERKETPTYESLRQRNRFGLTIFKVLRLIPSQLIGLAGVRQFLMRRPVPITNNSSSGQRESHSNQESISACSIELAPLVSERLKEYSRSRQVTVNDLLASTVFESVYEMHRENGGGADQWLRMMVPMSLREAECDKPLSACNVVSCVFLDRTGGQIDDHDQLLQSIHQEMSLIKRHRLALIFIFSLWIKKIFAWHFNYRDGYLGTRIDRCQTSFVFSNMARILTNCSGQLQNGKLTTGGISLQGCQILAPIAPLMSVAITAVQYAGRLTIALRYDWRCVSRQQAERLLANLVTRLESRVREGAAK